MTFPQEKSVNTGFENQGNGDRNLSHHLKKKKKIIVLSIYICYCPVQTRISSMDHSWCQPNQEGSSHIHPVEKLQTTCSQLCLLKRSSKREWLPLKGLSHNHGKISAQRAERVLLNRDRCQRQDLRHQFLFSNCKTIY